MQVDGDFSSSITTDANANASFTNPVKASQLAKGDFILTKNHPCKITAKTTSKPGKHGHANVRYVRRLDYGPFFLSFFAPETFTLWE